MRYQLLPDLHREMDVKQVVFKPGVVRRDGDYCFAGGSCSDIWKASIHRTPVVVKVWRLNPSLDSERDSFWRSLLKIVKTWKALQHPNIARCYGLAQDYGHLPGLVMPYYANGRLTDYLRDHPQEQVFPLVKDIARALHYLHQFNSPVVHGSLKCSNVFVNDEGRAVLCDFGAPELDMGFEFTRANTCSGCRWIAPETMIPPEPGCSSPSFTPMSDIYSFGMTVLEAYTKRQPFSHLRRDIQVIFEATRGARPYRPSEGECPQLTDEMWDLLEQCWAHVPRQRPEAALILSYLEALETSGS